MFQTLLSRIGYKPKLVVHNYKEDVYWIDDKIRTLSHFSCDHMDSQETFPKQSISLEESI